MNEEIQRMYCRQRPNIFADAVMFVLRNVTCEVIILNELITVVSDWEQRKKGEPSDLNVYQVLWPLQKDIRMISY